MTPYEPEYVRVGLKIDSRINRALVIHARAQKKKRAEVIEEYIFEILKRETNPKILKLLNEYQTSQSGL